MPDPNTITPEKLARLVASAGAPHVQLEAGMLVYDALYRWCRDAQGEKHDGSSHPPTRAKV